MAHQSVSERLEKFKSIDLVSSTPLLKDLYAHITPNYAAHWKVIGILLGLPSGTLDIIRHRNYDKSEHCCNAVLKKWLVEDSSASWGKLLKVIESPAVSSSNQELKGKKIEELYYQAKHVLGTEKLQLLKLLIFGPPGAGKSSLLKVLLGGDPDPVRNSTGVCDRKLLQYRIAVAMSGYESKSTWVKIEFEDEIRRLKQRIEERLNKISSASEDFPPNPKSANLKIEAKYFFSQTTQAQDRQISAFVQIYKQTSALIACYDSGGQPEFFDVMPALTTAPTGYVMVFDMSKDLMTKSVEFYRKGRRSSAELTAHYTNAELMKTALANIQSCAKSISSGWSITSRLSKFGHLLVVGTHLDKCGDTKDKQDDKVLQIEQVMEDDILRVPIDSTVHIVERDGKVTKLIHPISNTIKVGRDDVAQEIRTAIENMCDGDRTSEDIPISWLLFQLEVRHNEKYFISHQRCIEIAADCYIKKEDVNNILKYFHELGILLHYSDVPTLKHVVFCDPQWLFDKLTKLIELKYDPPHTIKQKILKGIFDKIFLSDVYKKDFVQNDILNYEHLLELFVFLNIMAVLPGEEGQYFMPALLNPAPPGIDVSLQQCYGRKKFDTLIVKFEDRYLPRGVFCCLVAECMKNAVGWSIQHNKAVYKDLIIFQVSSDQCIFVRDKIDHIAVEMYCLTTGDQVLSVSPDIICSKLYTALQEVCRKMKIVDDFKIGFACRYPLVDSTLCGGGFAVVKNQLPFQEELFCKQCGRKQNLEMDQVVWLISIKFLKNMGEFLFGQHQIQHGTNNKPTLQQLNRHVCPQAAARWEDIGIELLSANKIGIIKCNDSGDVKACCTKMFSAWLTQDTGASWTKVVNALRAPSVELFVLADEIESKFVFGSEDTDGELLRGSDGGGRGNQKEATNDRLKSYTSQESSNRYQPRKKNSYDHKSQSPHPRDSQQEYHHRDRSDYDPSAEYRKDQDHLLSKSHKRVYQKETSQKRKSFSHSSQQSHDRRESFQPRKQSSHRSQSPHSQQETILYDPTVCKMILLYSIYIGLLISVFFCLFRF